MSAFLVEQMPAVPDVKEPTTDETPLEKAKEEFRSYEDNPRFETVKRHYRLMRTNQCMEFSKRMAEKYGKYNNAKMTIREAFAKLENYVDSSDPDCSFPNIEHAFQTAEGIRQAGMPEWFQLVGLLHDMGKIMFLWGTPEDGQQGTADGDQWALGGDTWVVGHPIPTCVPFPEFNELNKDKDVEEYNTGLGIYKPGCGMMNVTYAYGHDEYMYQMLVHNKAKIPAEGLAMVRLHSCYPWHQGGCYEELMAEGDAELKEWVLKFNQFDLYTKADVRPDVEALWPHYQRLIDEMCPGELDW